MRIFDGYKESVRKLLTAAENDWEIAKHMHGTIADVLTVEKRYRFAIGAAVGVSVHNVITPTIDDARFLIEYLKKNGGIATFIPLDTIVPKENSEEGKGAREENGVLGLATELVGYDSYYEKVVYNLLGNTIVCDTIENAVAVTKKYSNRFKIVTLDGDIISVNGLVTGGECQKRFGAYFADLR